MLHKFSAHIAKQYYVDVNEDNYLPVYLKIKILGLILFNSFVFGEAHFLSKFLSEA
jgi:hypothetical protein